jgi:DNA-binding NarL/FixJ family response regulator
MSRPRSLTDREMETLRLLRQGHTRKEIAHLTGVSYHAVQHRTPRILRKLRAHTMIEAVGKAVQEGLLDV